MTGHLRGFSSIGLIEPKHVTNIGSVLRASYVYDSKMVAIQAASRRSIHSTADTPRAYQHVPVLQATNLRDLVPEGATPVAVDLVSGARSLVSFQHPKSAFYIFGPEDGTIPDEVLAWCPVRLMVPTRGCMNLAATVNVVLYDRMAKAERYARGIRNSDLGETE